MNTNSMTARSYMVQTLRSETALDRARRLVADALEVELSLVIPEEGLLDALLLNVVAGIYAEGHNTRHQMGVLVRRYGLRGHEPATLEALGVQDGVSRARISQIVQAGLRRVAAKQEALAPFISR